MPQTTDAVMETAELSPTGSPNQRYWDLCLKSFNNGDIATTAIQTVWAAMPPPASLPLLASIVGAIYADTYWATTKMDADRLARDLQASLGINPADCQKAARFAFSKWYGLLVRANFGDDGSIPKSGSPTASPDVIINGRTTLTIDQIIRMWNVYKWDPSPGLKNNTYGRAQSVNIQEPITTPRLSMYYSEAGFNPPPTSWVQMYTFDRGARESVLQGLQPGNVPVGGKAANLDSFAFQPPGTGHYCAIATASTEFFANKPFEQGGNWNSQEWIVNNGAAAWHNVDVQKTKDSVLKFYNQDAVSEHFQFEAHCSRVPAGNVVSLAFEDGKLASGSPASSLTIKRDYEVAGIESHVPPHYVGNLHLTIDGGPLPAGASVDVRMYWRLPHDHPHYLQAVDQLRDTRALEQKTPLRLPMGNFTFVGK
jgi:hypothetical protein